jgi:hypothetical protein
MSSVSTHDAIETGITALHTYFIIHLGETIHIEQHEAVYEALFLTVKAIPPKKRTPLNQLEATSSYLTSTPEDNECAICATELVATSHREESNLTTNHAAVSVIKLNTCRHSFQVWCLLKWLRESYTCPLYRGRVWQESTREMEGSEAAMSGRDEEAICAVVALWWERARNTSTCYYGTSQPQHHATFSALKALLDRTYRIPNFHIIPRHALCINEIGRRGAHRLSDGFLVFI